MKTNRREKASKLLSGLGYGKMKDLAAKSIDTPKATKKTKYASGGKVEGKAAKHTLDRKPRAAGGRTKGKGNHVKINIINASKPAQGGLAMPTHAPMPMQAPAPPQRPPMAAPAPGMPPQRPMGLATGGKVPHLTGGSGGGRGRLQKAAAEKRR